MGCQLANAHAEEDGDVFALILLVLVKFNGIRLVFARVS
jgi:hypothetical protein